MSRHFLYTALVSAAVLCSDVTPVQAGKFYLSSELGVNFGEPLGMSGSSNDRASVCDGYINPGYDQVEGTAGYASYNCTGPNRGSTGGWRNGFSADEGVLFGAALGYRLNDSQFRMELEYLYRDTGYDEISDVHGGSGENSDKLEQEIVRAIDGIDSMVSHSLFANLYADFTNDSRFTPYIGIGIGVGLTEVDYSSVWARNPDAGRIETGVSLPNAQEIRANLAGTSSITQKRLDDTLFGYQLIAGIDYALTDTLVLGIKGRWVDFDSLSERGVVWDPLRGHVPYLRTPEQAGGGDREFVEGEIKLDDIEMFAISVNLKYRF
ncbi:MAG: outer membrane beta-barrel protein [Gammaproteobacteria bacterium]|nr:outer membrane beta-barrel protein [Gammaproteobacteria bacterium]MDE0411895.1 outer membrane beta-barrel protein [Gammaproteobacteria bacterium]